MSPREESPLISSAKTYHHISFEEEPSIHSSSGPSWRRGCGNLKSAWILSVVIIAAGIAVFVSVVPHQKQFQPTGPYKLVERQVGESFFDFYDFYDGADSLGSAGYNTYVSKNRAKQIGIINATTEASKEYVFMKSASTKKGPREAVRLEGKRRFNRGLFVLDLDHMPACPGCWPAYWLTDEDYWPDHGEIDIVEGINNQTRAKTALHTSAQCSMFAHVPDYAKTGTWDRATGIPDTYTGQPNFDTDKEADDCWNMAAHQWGNQGCVLIDDQEGSIGEPFNENGGGVYALEWDPMAHHIKSWSFSRHTLPPNLEEALDDTDGSTIPDPDQWGAPYAYFAIGDTTGCSADHFQNMHIVFNLAFCGQVAGNRFFKDCAAETQQFNVSNDPIETCNHYIKSEPDELDEAYWKIRGVYVYEREMQVLSHSEENDDDEAASSSNEA